MVQEQVTIKNKLGLHARPAALFVQTSSKYKSDIYLARDEHEVNGKSIMGVMMLAAEMGAMLTLTIKGDDESDALTALLKLIEDKFYED